jgi:hypothetical protein
LLSLSSTVLILLGQTVVEARHVLLFEIRNIYSYPWLLLHFRFSLQNTSPALFVTFEPTTSSAKRSYNNTVHCCVSQQRPALTGGTVRDVVPIPHSAEDFLRNIPYRYEMWEQRKVHYGIPAYTGPFRALVCPEIVSNICDGLLCTATQ